MPGLTAAHRGYEYQDLLIATRLVDVVLGVISESLIDQKLFTGDRFDDLTTIDIHQLRERAQFKHTDNDNRPLTLATFTSDGRALRLDRLIECALKDRGESAPADTIFRVVLRDQHPIDERLMAVLRPSAPDPGPFLAQMSTTRLTFDAAALWSQFELTDEPFSFVRSNMPGLSLEDLAWVCSRLIIEVDAPAASGDLTTPGPAELMLLDRLRREVGADVFPNAHRSAVDVGDAFIGTARAARQGRLRVTAGELLRRAQLRTDFGAVAKSSPVDEATKISREGVLEVLLTATNAASATGGRLLLTGPPGQGKSWMCQQLVERLSDADWIVAEHYCFLGDADGERSERVLTDHLFGSLLARLGEADPGLVDRQRPRFAADEELFAQCLVDSQVDDTSRPIAVIVDGLDHITRVMPTHGRGSDPSLAVAEALAAIEVPPGCVLVVLSQRGEHLAPLIDISSSFDVPGLEDRELRELAEKHKVITPIEGDASAGTALLNEAEMIEEFLSALAERSRGNALYATYLCREVLRDRLVADAGAAVRALPAFDGTLEAYYKYLQESLDHDAGWVAEVIAVTNFGVARNELSEIFPEFAHRVDDALSHLGPVLEERASQGVRIYHESFARFIREGFASAPEALISTLRKVAQWLEAKGLFVDSRAYRNLFPILIEADRSDHVIELAGPEFVEQSIAAAFPASAVTANLGWAIRAAAAEQQWPLLVRYVEQSRAAEAFQDERYESVLVEFADVYTALVGAQVVGDRMIDEGRRVVPARAGLQMCAAIDRLGGVAPWPEYMIGYLRESEGDNTSYGADSDRAVTAAWVRGRLRLAASEPTSIDQPSGDGHDDAADLYIPIDWPSLAEWLDENPTTSADVTSAVHLTHGPDGLQDLIASSEHPGSICLAMAEAVQRGQIESVAGSRAWAAAAWAHGIGPGGAHRLIALGLTVDDLASTSLDSARARVMSLTEAVQRSEVRWESGSLALWLDLCALAARRDPDALVLVEASITGEGWYRCWLRFAVGLARAEAAPDGQQAELATAAIERLTDDLRRFAGDPRPCDLFTIHDTIASTIRRAVDLLHGSAWVDGIRTLQRVSEEVSSSLSGELGGPLPADLVLDLAVRTADPENQAAADELVDNEIQHGSASRYYSDLASYRLHRARLALATGRPDVAADLWREACALFGGYGWHKDITIYELLDPLPDLISADPKFGRRALAEMQGLCERVLLHTDGKETYAAPSRWWNLLAQADPVALADIAAKAVLDNCNEPSSRIFEAIDDLWRHTSTKADPVASAGLRASIDSPLETNDPVLLSRLLDAQGIDDESIRRLFTMVVSRHDERHVAYSYSNGNETLARDDELALATTRLAREAGLAVSTPFREPPPVANDPSTGRQVARSYLQSDPAPITFDPGTVGLGRAIRSWRNRPYETNDLDWSVERFTALIGYRLVELAQEDRVSEARNALDSLAGLTDLGDRSGLLSAVAEGLERHGLLELSAHAYTLAWTRTRGHGGLFNFGGDTGIEHLRTGAGLDPHVAREVVAEEVERFVVGGRFGTYGISQALIVAFASGALPVPPGTSAGFDAWQEAYAAISRRAPVVDPSDEPSYPYAAPDVDPGTSVVGDLDEGLAVALVAGLAHASLERKRRTLLALAVLTAIRPGTLAQAFAVALEAKCDPATHQWLLSVLDASNDDDLRRACRGGLVVLAQSPYLAVRALARSLLGSAAGDLPPPGRPDAALMSEDVIDWFVGTDEERHASANVLHYAALRLSEGSVELPGLGPTVRSRVIAELASDIHKGRHQRQQRAFADESGKRWPDTYFAKEQVIEESLQLVAGTGRAARLLAGEPVGDPMRWEADLGAALLDHPGLSLALEATRRPRPNVPALPPPASPWWLDLRSKSDEKGNRSDGFTATVSVEPSEAFPVAEGWPIDGWRWLGTLEERTFRHPSFRRREDWLVALRYRMAELRNQGDDRALTRSPVAAGDFRLWNARVDQRLSWDSSETQPLLGVSRDHREICDGLATLGAPEVLITPTAGLIAALDLRALGEIGYADESGPALLLATWRADYDRSDYHLPIARTVGSGVAIRGDLFDRLAEASEGRLVLRDFVMADAELGTSDREDEAE